LSTSVKTISLALQCPSSRDEAIDRFAFGRTDIRRGDDAQFAAASEIRVERFFEQTQAVPLDECAEEVDPIGRGDLALDRVSDRRLAARVDEEIALRRRL
jgi:hypothetical protein